MRTRARIAFSVAALAGAVAACTTRSHKPGDLFVSTGGAAAPDEEVSVDGGNASDAGARAASSCMLSGPPQATTGDVLVFADEFAGAAVDPAKWNVETGDLGHGTILNSSAPANARVRDGALSIVTDRSANDAALPYVSGFVDTLGKFARTYGKFEVRARFPYIAGVWYALWGTPWSQPFPEIDIELTNLGASQLWFVNHWAAPPLPSDSRRAYVVQPVSVKAPNDGGVDFSQFHTYSLLWKPDLIELSIDGEPKMQRTTLGVPDLPFLWKINAWVGGWGGTPNDDSPFPVAFDVDYVRIYRVDGLIADPLAQVLNKKSHYARTDVITVAVANFDEACFHVDMFDGATRVQSASAAPIAFSLEGLALGDHSLSFVATDGVRSTVTSLDVGVE